VATAVEAQQEIGVRNLLEAGLHFGHQTKRWNPKMKRFIFDKRNGIHIIDLAKSLAMLNSSLAFIEEAVANGKSILFVGTKKQAQEVIKETATTTGQHYVSTRWLGGMLTNSQTIRKRVQRMRQLEALETNKTFDTMHKKEVSTLRHELEKLQRNLSGVAGMAELPGAVFVVDINRESIAVAEANRLAIPVIAIVDTNCNPDAIDYPIPGNDDAIRAIKLIATTIGEAVKKGAAKYAKVAAELARKKEAEEAKEKARRAADAEKKAAEKAEAEKKMDEKIAADKKAAAEKKSGEKKTKEETDTADKKTPQKKALKAKPVSKEEPDTAPKDEPAPPDEPAPETAGTVAETEKTDTPADKPQEKEPETEPTQS
jgi:small subunit ribosomal protein S2